MATKLLLSIMLTFAIFSVKAQGLTYQVVEKELLLTPNLVKQIEMDAKNPNILRLSLTEEGLKEFNTLILNSYDKKLNVIFNGKVISLSMPIKMFELSNPTFYLSTDDKESATEIFNYFNTKK